MEQQTHKGRWILFIALAVLFTIIAFDDADLVGHSYGYLVFVELLHIADSVFLENIPVVSLGMLTLISTAFLICNKNIPSILLSLLCILVSVLAFVAFVNYDIPPYMPFLGLNSGFLCYFAMFLLINASAIICVISRNKLKICNIMCIFFLIVGILPFCGWLYTAISDGFFHYLAPLGPPSITVLALAFVAGLNIKRTKYIKKPADTYQQAGSNFAYAQSDGYVDLIKHILLSIFTFGIWSLIWTYRTTRYLNKAPGAQWHDPTKKLLLCIFVPFYQIYWYYVQGQRLDSLAAQKNPHASSRATLYLILGIFIPVVASILMQDCINGICTAQESPAETAADTKNVQSNMDDLIKLKELLDMGVITQEEFDAKKKQLLGL